MTEPENKTFALHDGATLTPEQDAAVKNAFDILLEKIKLAEAAEPNLQVYYNACEEVKRAADTFSELLEEAGVSANFNYSVFGADNNYPTGYDYGDWVAGAYIAETWVPSSMGC